MVGGKTMSWARRLKDRWHQYFAERNRRAEYQRFEEGFGWAMCAYYLEGCSLEDLRDYMMTSGLAMERPRLAAFDDGVEEAIAKIESMIDRTPTHAG